MPAATTTIASTATATGIGRRDGSLGQGKHLRPTNNNKKPSSSFFSRPTTVIMTGYTSKSSSIKDTSLINPKISIPRNSTFYTSAQPIFNNANGTTHNYEHSEISTNPSTNISPSNVIPDSSSNTKLLLNKNYTRFLDQPNLRIELKESNSNSFENNGNSSRSPSSAPEVPNLPSTGPNPLTSTDTLPNSNYTSSSFPSSSSSCGSSTSPSTTPPVTPSTPSSPTSYSTPPSTPVLNTVNEDDVSCAICLDLLHRPRELPCRHSFCLICLQNYVESSWKKFSCPSCRGEVEVPLGGVCLLPVNKNLTEDVLTFKINRSSIKLSPLCSECLTEVAGGVSICGHCRRGLCGPCSSSHIMVVLQDLKQLKETLCATKDTLHCRRDEEEGRLARLEENITAAVEEKVAGTHERGRILSIQVGEMRDRSISDSNKLSSRIEEAMTSLKMTSLNVCHNTPVTAIDHLSQLHNKISKLIKSASIDRRPRVTLDEELLTLSSTKTALTSHNSREDLVDTDHIEDILLAATPDDGGRLPVAGGAGAADHSLFYRRKSSHTRHRWGQNLGERLAGVAVSPVTSEIYVTGSDTCKVCTFDNTGRHLASWGSRGHNEGQFLCPVGLAISHTSREIFVSDKWKHCLHVFDLEGNFIRQVGRKGKGFGHFSSPEGVATDSHGRIYVADTGNDRIQVLDCDGGFLREIGVVSSERHRDGRRYTKSELSEPTGVAVSVDGSRVYVADSGNHRVKVFDGITGQRLVMFGSRGRNKGQFDSPECIAVDTEGFIIVGDSGNGRVQVFRPNGNFIRYFGTKSRHQGEFGWVSGVGVSKAHDIIVTDFKNCVIGVF